ncbi:MAG: diaminopimelate decarboxylase, partial [bacterium]
MRIDCRENGMVKLGNQTVAELTEQFGSPLYVYDEKTLRERCRQLKSLCTLPNFHIAYSAKANTSIALMKIIREEGIGVDAMTLGEIYLE